MEGITTNSFEEENLTTEDVNYLIHTLKYPTSLFKLDELRNKIEDSITLVGTEIDGDSVILGVIDNIEYVLHVYCGDPLIERPKYTINLRFKKSNIQLVRVDVGGRHKNPGEKSAACYPHIHIYDPNYSKKDRVAYQLDPKDFPNIDSILNTFDAVMRYTNIQRNK